MSDDRVTALEARIRELEDVKAINDVFHKWHYACTGGFNGKQAGRMEALECLTEDATIEIQGLHEPGKGPTGRKEYTEFWEYYYGDAGPLPYVYQVSIGENVEVTGDTAVQKSTMLIILKSRAEEGMTLHSGLSLTQRVNHFVRTPEGWKIKKTTNEGGYTIAVDDIHGNLNKLPPMEKRTPWQYRGQ